MKRIYFFIFSVQANRYFNESCNAFPIRKKCEYDIDANWKHCLASCTGLDDENERKCLEKCTREVNSNLDKDSTSSDSIRQSKLES